MKFDVIWEEKEDKNVKTSEVSQVSACTRYIPLIRGQDTLYHALHQIQKHKSPFLIIERGSKQYGFLTEEDILNLYLEETALHTTVHQVLRKKAPVFLHHTDPNEIAKRLTVEEPIAVILDAKEEYMGIVNVSDLLCSPKSSYPSPVGGIATPFGIYLTNGGVSAGVARWVLGLTGLVFVFVMQISYLIVNKLTTLIFQIETLSLFRNLNLFPGAILCFLILFRLSPLSGIHGAEHMVIHALERGEPLQRGYVAKMPRIHSRCGTNISVSLLSGLGIYFCGIGSEISPGKLGLGIDFIIANLFTFLMGTSLGNFVQFVFTTKKPSRKQLNLAIEVGRKLNENYIKRPIVWPNLFLRILNSGMIWIVFGGLMAFWILSLAKIL